MYVYSTGVSVVIRIQRRWLGKKGKWYASNVYKRYFPWEKRYLVGPSIERLRREYAVSSRDITMMHSVKQQIRTVAVTPIGVEASTS
jgi:hypothetical protein